MHAVTTTLQCETPAVEVVVLADNPLRQVVDASVFPPGRHANPDIGYVAQFFEYMANIRLPTNCIFDELLVGSQANHNESGLYLINKIM